MSEDFGRADEIIKKADTIKTEVEAMFGENYRDMLSVSQKQIFDDLIGKTKLFNIVGTLVMPLVEVEHATSQFMKFEWPVVKCSQQKLEEILTQLQGLQEKLRASEVGLLEEITDQDQLMIAKTVL